MEVSDRETTERDRKRGRETDIRVPPHLHNFTFSYLSTNLPIFLKKKSISFSLYGRVMKDRTYNSRERERERERGGGERERGGGGGAAARMRGRERRV